MNIESIHDISLAMIGTLPNELGWVYGISDLVIIALIIFCLVFIFCLPFKIIQKW